MNRRKKRRNVNVKSILAEGLNMCRQRLNDTKGYRQSAEHFSKKT